MTTDERLFIKRLEDLDRKAQNNYYVCYTDFLDANEYSLFLEHRREFISETQVFSGIDMLERQMIAFIPDALVFDGSFPIQVIKITGKNARFVGEMTHRDVLGTLMGLSVERRLFGDILAFDGGFYVLATPSIVPVIEQEIHRIRHTEVVVSQVDWRDVKVERTFLSCFGTVASMRLDCIVAEMAHVSRSQALHLIQSGMVYINARQTYQNTIGCKEDDVLSIRKVGKFRIVSIGSLSRKGKIKLSYEQYC